MRIEPKDAEARNNLGLVFAGAGMLERAAEEHRAALDIEPQYPEAAYNLGLAYRAMGRTQAAAEMFALALTLAPNLLPAQEQLKELGIDEARIQVDDGSEPLDAPEAPPDAAPANGVEPDAGEPGDSSDDAGPAAAE